MNLNRPLKILCMFLGVVIFGGLILFAWGAYLDWNDDYLAAKHSVIADEHEILKSLISKIDLDRQIEHTNFYIDNQTLLHVAVANNATKSVSLLLSKGADPNLKNGLGQTPLAIAVQRHRPNKETREIVKLLISHGALVDVEDIDGNTLLHLIAVVGYSSEYCQVIVENGANVNALNNAGNTPLHAAVFGRNLAAVETLLSLDADTGVMNSVGRDPMFYARELKYLEILQAFEQNKDKNRGNASL